MKKNSHTQTEQDGILYPKMSPARRSELLAQIHAAHIEKFISLTIRQSKITRVKGLPISGEISQPAYAAQLKR